MGYIDMPRRSRRPCSTYRVLCRACGYQTRCRIVDGDERWIFVCFACGDCEPIVDIVRS
jgi:hypothetical protein